MLISSIQVFIFILLSTNLVIISNSQCQPCFYTSKNQNCQQTKNIKPLTLHMSVHPHLDAFWIYDFDTYYNGNEKDQSIKQYFQGNHFSPVKQIFNSILEVLAKSKQYRQAGADKSEKGHRSFFNSEIGFFKHWFTRLNSQKKKLVKQLLHTQYWQILGGGIVQHDEACSYYEDIIQNFELGLHFLKQQLNYIPKIAVSSDSFGHSQSTAAILAHLGMQGYLVERSDEHILTQKKTQFIWLARSSNNIVYGALPTNIRWAIHGFQDQFSSYIEQQTPICQSLQTYIENIRNQNKFLRNLTKTNHIMRYFGHDFQKFSAAQFQIIEAFMQQFARQKCQNVIALYTNPTQYFKILIEQLSTQDKYVKFRNQDIFPIWDYDSGLFWTGYYTTDPYHKKYYRDCGRFLYAVRKAFFSSYIKDIKSNYSIKGYEILQQFAEIVAYLQHHDGISGTSKYNIMDQYQIKAQKLVNKINKYILPKIFQDSYTLYTANQVLICGIFRQCTVPDSIQGNIYIKIFNSGVRLKLQPIIIHLPENKFYHPNCNYEIICMCLGLPCACQLYLYLQVYTFSEILLTKTTQPQNIHFMKQTQLSKKKNQFFTFNKTHIVLNYRNEENKISIGYKKVLAEPTQRQYQHLDRYGQKRNKTFTVNSGKYALGNNIDKVSQLSQIRKVYQLKSNKLTKILIIWKREQLKTIIQSTNLIRNSWKVQTISAAQSEQLADFYVQFSSSVKNNDKFYTDSNGWLTVERTLFSHQDYKAFFSEKGFDKLNGNTYPMTSFAYIQDDKSRLIINTDRPQGVVSLQQGKIWVNFDRITTDDGKWVYETAYRSEYQKFTHYVTLQTQNEQLSRVSHRIHQQMYDQSLLIQLNQIEPNQRLEFYHRDAQIRNRWAVLSGIEHTKFWVRPWNDSTLTFRIQNIYDNKVIKIGLYNENFMQYLTTYYGNGVQFQQIEELSLGSNMKYEQFLKNKWNWNNLFDLTNQNQIFNKIFGEQIQLRPLEIRTFKLKGIKVGSCSKLSQLRSTSSLKKEYKIDIEKEKPARSPAIKQKQIELVEYLYNGDHCKAQVPILFKEKYQQIKPNYNKIQGILFSKDLNQDQKYDDQIQKQLAVEADPYKNKKNLYDPVNSLYKIEQQVKQQLIIIQKSRNDESMIKNIKQLKQKVDKLRKMTADEKQSYFSYKLRAINKYLAK